MSRRLSVIDLTSASVPAPAPAPTSTSTSTSTHRQLSSDITSVDSFSDSLEEQPTPNLRNHTVPRGAKRRRDGEELGHAGPSSRPRLDHPIDPRIEGPIQAIDLTEVDSSSELAKTLSSLREDAVKSQQPHGDEANSARSVLGSYKCPICMDTPEDATSTACGHLFCHRCILECLATADARNSSSDSNKNKGTCPVCRKSITKNDTAGPRRSLIPLQLKLTTKKRNMAPPTEA